MTGIFVPDIMSDLSDVPTRVGQSLKFLRVNAGETAFEYAVPASGGSANLPWVNVADAPFNAVGDGITDDTAAIQAALDSFGALNAGTVIIPPTFKCVVDGNLNIPDFVTLTSFSAILGTENSLWANTINSGPILFINSAASITVNKGVTISNLKIYRKGIQFNITSAQVATQFLGTAITIAAGSNDFSIYNCIVAGFLYGIQTVTNGGIQRVRAWQLMMDNINCIALENCFDITYLGRIHCWPLVTVAAPAEAQGMHIRRLGSGIKLFGTNDWTKVTDCFNFGYQVGYDLTNGSDVTFTGCGADHTPASSNDGSIGFRVSGGSIGTRFMGCQAAAKNTGFVLNTTGGSNKPTTLIGCTTWAVDGDAVSVLNSDAQILGCGFQGALGSTKGVSATGVATNNIVISTTTFFNSGVGINSDNATRNVKYGGCTFANNTTNTVNVPAAGW